MTDPLTGYLDLCTRDALAGWAMDPASPERAIRLSILQNGTVIDEITATQFRSDLTAQGRAGHCAFHWLWPDPPPHEGCHIDIQEAETQRPLLNTPLIIPPLPSALEGCIDLANRHKIAGWVRDNLNPHRTVWLTLYINGQATQRIPANSFRHDLREAGLGHGRYGFEHNFTPPLDPLQDYSLQLHHGTTPFLEPALLPRATTLTTELRHYIANTINNIHNETERQQTLAFLTEQSNTLRDQAAATVTARAEKDLSRRAKRLFQTPNTHSAPCILIIDDQAPDPSRDAGSVALLSHIRAIQSLGYECCFIASRLPSSEEDHLRLSTLGITCLMPPIFTGPEEALKRLGDGLEAVYLHRLNNAESYSALTRAFAPTATLIWSIADLASRRLQRQSSVEARPELLRVAQRLEIRENMCAWLADTTITHSDVETKYLQRQVPTAHPITIPWDVPIHRRAKAPSTTRPVIAFIAHFAHAPNLDAAKWLILDILPRLLKHLPNLTCRLIGSAMPHALHMLPQNNVEIIGYVPDIGTALHDVTLCVAPLRFGAGIKGKVLESWSFGVPIIMTPIAAEGIIPEDHPTLSRAIAHTAEDFTHSILAHLKPSVAKAHITASRTLLRSTFHKNTIQERFRSILPPAEEGLVAYEEPVLH
ncbi:glycosyltransferase [Neokomagataea anthophila]|uniref:Glycosyltransferase n=1 Tax=Neokomagataea anthophila TaxID=2826925 RepID=A0ABS5E8F7_9PROT|nr:glycosyltransferase [Neokomagataea anthophila]